MTQHLFFTCPSCAYRWLGAILTDWDEMKPETCAKCPYCPRCDQRPPMMVEVRARQPESEEVMLSVKVIEQRLHERRCIDCGLGQMPEEGHSGFWKHRCDRCKEAYEAPAKANKGETGPARAKGLIDEGVANLDRLLGVSE